LLLRVRCMCVLSAYVFGVLSCQRCVLVFPPGTKSYSINDGHGHGHRYTIHMQQLDIGAPFMAVIVGYKMVKYFWVSTESLVWASLAA
jgi:hypothetical protein